MIKKKECIEFLGKVEEKALNSVKEKYRKLIDVEEEKLLLPYVKEISELQVMTNALHEKASSLYEKLQENKNIALDDWCNLAYEIRNFIGTNAISNIITGCSKFSDGPVQKLKAEKDKELAKVRAEYEKVAMILQSKANGTKAAECLKEIGFDISSLEDAENNKLIPTVDKKCLFVCGERK